MQCEICGAQIAGKSHRVLVDRAELEVCDKCKGFGKEVERRAPVTSMRRGPPAPVAGQPAVRRGRRDLFDNLKDELVEDYASRIKAGREAKHLTQEELAQKILEKVNIIRKVERAEIEPEDSLVKKLERELDIKLKEGVDDADSRQQRGESRSLTLGDLLRVKKEK